ncbi:MAG: acyl-CoA thioesterase [Candidatus Cryptobacteroides sp.]|jgi:acyl-CoA thioester hydrolase
MIRFQTTIKVRYYECDPMGVVHHSNYIRYFECARNEMMDAWGYTVEQCQADGITFPMASAELRFHRPALAGDFLTVTAEMDKLPLAKLVVKQQVFNQKGELCCDGVVTLGFLSAETGRPTRCPERLLAIMQAAQEE